MPVGALWTVRLALLLQLVMRLLRLLQLVCHSCAVCEVCFASFGPACSHFRGVFLFGVRIEGKSYPAHPRMKGYPKP